MYFYSYYVNSKTPQSMVFITHEQSYLRLRSNLFLTRKSWTLNFWVYEHCVLTSSYRLLFISSIFFIYEIIGPWSCSLEHILLFCFQAKQSDPLVNFSMQAGSSWETLRFLIQCLTYTATYNFVVFAYTHIGIYIYIYISLYFWNKC